MSPERGKTPKAETKSRRGQAYIPVRGGFKYVLYDLNMRFKCFDILNKNT